MVPSGIQLRAFPIDHIGILTKQYLKDWFYLKVSFETYIPEQNRGEYKEKGSYLKFECACSQREQDQQRPQVMDEDKECSQLLKNFSLHTLMYIFTLYPGIYFIFRTVFLTYMVVCFHLCLINK